MKNLPILKIAAAILLFLIINVEVDAQSGKIYGHVKGKDGDRAAGATVELRKDGAPAGGVITKEDGKFSFGMLEQGTYSLRITDANKRVYQHRVVMGPNESKLTFIDMALANNEGDEGEGASWGTDIPGIDVIGGNEELFTVDPIDPYVITSEEIRKRPLSPGSIGDIAAIAPRITQPDQGDPLNMSGSRPNATVTFVNGVKVRGGNQIPIAGIEQVSVLNGGIPAEYGDVTGGVIIVKTKNPGMRGYFGPANPNKVRRAIRKKHKRLIEQGDDSYLFEDERIFSMNTYSNIHSF